MFLRLLDRWDESRAFSGEKVKFIETFAIGSELAFPQAGADLSIVEFCRWAESAKIDPAYFDIPEGYAPQIEIEDGWLRFPSAVQSDIPVNNRVTAKVTQYGPSERALIIFHHWNASSRQRVLAGWFARLGITVVEVSMPYHFERSRPGAAHADYMLSANLGRTLQSVRQAVVDGRSVVRWLSGSGYREISVLGMSLGSWVAGLVAAHDPAVSRASLFLTADSLADMVWTGRATRAIQKALEPAIDLPALRQAWGPVDLGSHAQRLARSDLGLHMVLARRDTVVLPGLTRRFVGRLRAAGADPVIKELSCGHYSLALPPFGLMAGMSLKHFLNDSS